MTVLIPTGGSVWSGKEYQADLGKDRFVHFTTADRATQILETGKLLMRPPYPKFGIDAVNAVSMVWGSFVPGVQTTHSKDPLVAIVFQTSTVPKYGYPEEVVWDKDVTLRNPKVIRASKAISMLKRTPEQIEDGDMVVYGKSRARAASVAQRFLEGKTFTVNIGDPIFYGKYKNKRGIVREFKTGPKGDPIVVIEQVPNETGRKQPKELKLFKIRYDKERAEQMKADKTAARVAERFLTGGTFEAPPQVLKDILAWALPIYGGHVLAHAQRRLESLRDNEKPLITSKNRMVRSLRTLDQDLAALGTGDVLKIQMDMPDPGSMGLIPSFVGAKSLPGTGRDGGPMFYTDHARKNMTFRKNPWPRNLGSAGDWIGDALNRAILLIDRRLLDVRQGGPDDEGLVETNLLARAASKYATKAKHYATKTATTIPVDLTGWKYMPILLKEANERVQAANAQLTLQIQAVRNENVYTKPLKLMGFDFPEYMPLSEAKKRYLDPVTEANFGVMLKGRNFDKIKVILDFKGHSTRGGQWIERDRELQIDVRVPDPRSVAAFQEGVEEIIRVARHESQHIGQDLIKLLTPAGDKGGLPSPRVRDPKKTPMGFPKDMDPRSPHRELLRDPHALQDVEFYTRIEDEISKFVRKVRRYPLNSRRDALQVWVGAKKGPLTIEGMPGYVPTADFFGELKRNQRGKWEKAVAEFVKGVSKAGVKLPPDAGKVAASVSPRDLEDALEHVSDIHDKPLSLEDFEVSPVKKLSLRDLYRYDDIDSWAEFDEGEFEGYTPEEIEEELTSFRGRAWARRAAEWIKKGTFPPIIIVDTSDDIAIGDGRGRVTLALAMGWDRVPAVFLTEKMPSASRVAAKYQKKKEVPKADGKGTTTVYEYSEKQVQHRDREKAKRVEKLRKDLGKLQGQIKKDLKSKDDKTRMTALAVGLINDTFERVGNPGSAKDGHFGVTGWLVKHVTVSGNKATFKYVGKSGVDQKKETTDVDLVRVLKDAIKGKGKDDEVFGGDVRIDSSVVNEYLEPFDITAKDIRGLHANREMQRLLKSVRSKGGKLPTDKKEREKKLKDEFKEALEGAAAAVGHEASTLKSQYLVPGLEDDYLQDGVVNEKLTKKGSAARVASRVFNLPFHKRAIININNATDGDSEELRGLHGLISSLTMYEQAIVQDMLIHDVGIDQGPEGYTLRGHRVEPDAVTELIGAGYLQDVEDAPILISDIFRAKEILYTASQQDIGPQLSEAFDALLQPIQDAVDGLVPPQETEPWNICPVCGAEYESSCRCHIGDRTCPNGHKWVWCPVHERNVVVPEGVNTHELPIPRPKNCVCWIENIHDHVDINDPEFNEILREVYAKVATKTPLEIEDEEAERLVRPDPKKKPPRTDLRRRLMEEKPEGDDDMKKEAASVASRWRRRVALVQFLEAADEPEHKPGDTWKSKDKFVGKNSDGESQSFDSEDAAKAFATGKKDEKKDEDPDAKKDKAPEETDEDRQKREEDEAAQAEAAQEKMLDEAEAAYESITGEKADARAYKGPLSDFAEDLQKKIEGLGAKDQEAMAKGFSKGLKALKGQKPMGSDDLKAAREAIGTDLEGKSPDELGNLLAGAFYAERVTFNPLLVGDTPLSKNTKPATGKEKREEGGIRRAKAEAAYDYFQMMDKDERKKMADVLGKEADDLDKESPRFREIQALYNGLCMASQANGEDLPNPTSSKALSAPRVSESFGALFGAMKAVGEEKRLLGSVEDFSAPESQEAIRTAMSSMTDDELGDLIGGSDSPMYGLIETLTDPEKSKRLGPRQRDKLRKMIEDAVVDNVALLDPMAMEIAEVNGEKDPAKAAVKAIREFDSSKEATVKRQSVMEALEEDDGEDAESEMSALELALQEMRKFRITEFPAFIKKKFKKTPKRSIPFARADALKNEGDLSVLTQRFVMSPAASH